MITITLPYEAIKEAYRQGVIMVAPCGDDGGLGVKYPARYYEVLAVGSTNANDQISIFSQSGTDLDLVAPRACFYQHIIEAAFSKVQEQP